MKRNEERCMRENTKISKKHKRKKMTLVSRQNERTLREKERKKERKEKESANATTRIILLSIARYHNHLLCASVIFHYSN